MDIHNFLASHHYASETKRTYTAVLSRLFAEADPAALDAAGLLDLIQSQGWGNSRQCLALAASQKYIQWKYGAQHPALSARLKRITGKMPRAITREQADTIFSACNTATPAGARNLALFALALDTGLRLSELCRLQQADTNTGERLLQVLIKGGRWEFAVYTEQTAHYIEHWKKFRLLLTPNAGELFLNTRTAKKLTPDILASIARYHSHKCGVPFSMHDFRRGFATIATENGATERDLMLGGRWTSSQMIVKYTRSLRLENMRKYLPLNKE